MQMRTLKIATISLLLNTAANVQAAPESLVKPQFELIDASISPAQAQAIRLAAQRYYSFWHTGNNEFAQAALATNFVDLNLPEGREQGPQGPIQASQQFRAAIPDLKVTVEEMLIVGDRTIGRLRFKGHFTGRFADTQGKGQNIEFVAVDIYRVADGKIVENWHLEDNLTLLKQMGLVAQ